MKPLVSFREFEESSPLHQKITPQLAESLADYFAQGDPRVNEGFFDDVKNFLSKSFLGSLSYINMIDKVRAEVLKLEKELVIKRYAYQDEMESLTKSLGEASKTGAGDAVSKIQKTIDLKRKEHDSYENVTNSRIQKALEKLREATKGNKRRKEYYETGRSEDELELAEFEYQEAKKRASTGSDDLKKLEQEIQKAKEEAEKAQQEMKAQQEKEAQSKKNEEKAGVATLSESKPDFEKSLRSVKGTRALLLYLKKEKEDLKDRIHDAKNDNAIAIINNQINKIEKDIELAQNVLKQHEDKKIVTQNKKYQQMIIDGSKQISKHQAERDGVLKGDKSDQGKKSEKAGQELKDQQKKAKTTGKINNQVSKTNQRLKP